MAEKIPEVIKLRQRASNLKLDRQTRSAAAFDLRRYKSDIQETITRTAPVLVTSCIGAHQLLVDSENESTNFQLVVLDEAAQTTEPALVCALAAAKAEQVVLVGDTRQLPPTVTSPDLRNSLGVSPMARLEKMGVGETTLRMQYRMPAALLEHPSKYFYGGLVTCATDGSTVECENISPLPLGFKWPSSLPLAFINVSSSENCHNFGGRSNLIEAEMVGKIASDLLEAGDVDGKNIAVISPYSKQVQLIRTELSNGRKNGAHNIKVGTVDSFQGQETDVVLFSAVRSNDANELGFLRDPRRLCVAITRARRGLILIGDRSVLRSCRHWAALLDSCDERGCSVDVEDFNEEEKRLLGEAEAAKSEILPPGDLPNTEDGFYGLFS